MEYKSKLPAFLCSLLLEKPARRIPLVKAAAQMEASGQRVLLHLSNMSDSPKNRRRLTHIIGIERWGQSRLLTALGDPLVMQEYDLFRPAETMDWMTLREIFRETRNTTLTLVSKLDAAGAAQILIPHNSLGPLSVGAWLRYLTLHAEIESWKMH